MNIHAHFKIACRENQNGPKPTNSSTMFQMCQTCAKFNVICCICINFFYKRVDTYTYMYDIVLDYLIYTNESAP